MGDWFEEATAKIFNETTKHTVTGEDIRVLDENEWARLTRKALREADARARDDCLKVVKSLQDEDPRNDWDDGYVGGIRQAAAAIERSKGDD